MGAACLINDLKPAIKVSLFARDALGVHVPNAKGHRCPPGTAVAEGELSEEDQ